MVKGRAGYILEGWKFAVYLMIPLAASAYFNNVENQKRAADYWQFIKYPENPDTGWKERIELMVAQQSQRQAYREQMEQLNRSANPNDDEAKKAKGWRRWIGWGRPSSNGDESKSSVKNDSSPAVATPHQPPSSI